jgi:hypothetical protein
MTRARRVAGGYAAAMHMLMVVRHRVRAATHGAGPAA